MVPTSPDYKSRENERSPATMNSLPVVYMTSMPTLISLPVGFRFHPTDEELINYFLKLKIQGYDSLVQHIAEVDICGYEPWELRRLSAIQSTYPEWYFFSRRDPHSSRMTPAGFWKVTGPDRNIRARGSNSVIGTKKILVYHSGSVGIEFGSDWVIHEYHLDHSVDTPLQLRNYVICCLKYDPRNKASLRTLHDTVQ